MPTDLSAPQNFINRELSWLEFNQRVLEEAEDPTQPLLERVKFMSIFSSNLDEFFEIRVAGIKQQIEGGVNDAGPDELTPPTAFEAIQKKAHELVGRQYALWKEKLVPGLAAEHIRLHDPTTLSDADRKWTHRFFTDEVFPVLTPLAVDASHPFPQVVNKSHNLIVRARTPRSKGEPLYAIVQVPRAVTRLVRLPSRTEDGAERYDYVYLSDLIKLYAAELFPGLKLEGVHAFRITRNSDLYIDDEEAVNLLATIEQELIRARRGDAVRIEVEASCPPDFQKLLMERFGLSEPDLYTLNGPISMTHLGPLFSSDAFPKLKDRPYVPVFHPALPRRANAFDVIRKRDVLLHHPYHSFEPVVDLVEAAAVDPQVLAIKMTLYRTSGDSPIVAALAEAAINGKQVTAVVEVKARFDEANNIRWAQQLEEAGAHVVYGVVGLKTHCKAMLIVRRDEDRLRQYVHLGTGNYNPKTARLYTDLSLFSANKELAQEVAGLFNTLTGLVEYSGFKRLMVAPFDLAPRLKGLIQRERDNAKAGKPAGIVAKINSLVDEEIIVALYEASNAGVNIDLIVRGICALRPQMPGVSENIRVISIIGRFLEHSRIYSFTNGGSPEVYLASADWMPRNLYRRVETAFLIEEPALRDELIKEVLPAFMNDRVKARELRADGSYIRLKRPPGVKNPPQAQLQFRAHARGLAAAAANAPSPAPSRLQPQQVPPTLDGARAAEAASKPAAPPSTPAK
jgi:polyphosphate kinase